jgi:hypothetical protein
MNNVLATRGTFHNARHIDYNVNLYKLLVSYKPSLPSSSLSGSKFVSHNVGFVLLFQAGVISGAATTAFFFVTMVEQVGVGYGLVFPSQKF